MNFLNLWAAIKKLGPVQVEAPVSSLTCARFIYVVCILVWMKICLKLKKSWYFKVTRCSWKMNLSRNIRSCSAVILTFPELSPLDLWNVLKDSQPEKRIPSLSPSSTLGLHWMMSLLTLRIIRYHKLYICIEKSINIFKI